MKVTRETLPKQAKACHTQKGDLTIETGSGGSASVFLGPTAVGHGDRHDPLLYQGCSNSDKCPKSHQSKSPNSTGIQQGRGVDRKDDKTPKNKEYKIMKSLRENMKEWGKMYGVEHLAFMTITVPDKKVLSVEELRKRFNNFNRQFSRLKGFKWMYKGIEPQKRGQYHFHLVVYSEESLEPEKVNWDAYNAMHEERKKNGRTGKYYNEQRKLTRSVTPATAQMWTDLRRICKGSGLGISEFLPIRSVNSIGSYVGKYLNKCFSEQEHGNWAKGLRRFSYARWVPQPYGRQFSWVNSNKGNFPTWREKVAVWAYAKGVRDEEDMVEKYGKLWCRNQIEEINLYGLMHRFQQDRGKRFGWDAPAQYPTGRMGSPLKSMASDTREVPEHFHLWEDYAWNDWLNPSARHGLRNHAESVRKYQRAEKERKLQELKYG